jgi:hypothetical protein
MRSTQPSNLAQLQLLDTQACLSLPAQRFAPCLKCTAQQPTCMGSRVQTIVLTNTHRRCEPARGAQHETAHNYVSCNCSTAKTTMHGMALGASSHPPVPAVLRS